MAWPRLLTALILATAFPVDGALAQMPPAIATPGEDIVATFHAEGAQIYECKPGNEGKLAWVFRKPIATLLLDDKTVGRHYAGPTWEHGDGSAVTGKAVGNAPGATVNDIPWLKLEGGSGTLADVTTVPSTAVATPPKARAIRPAPIQQITFFSARTNNPPAQAAMA